MARLRPAALGRRSSPRHVGLALPLALAAAGAPYDAKAQRVELLTFSEKLSVVPLASGVERAVRTDDLVHHFDLFAAPTEPPLVPSLAASFVPAWMLRKAVTSPAAELAMPPAPTICAALPYRPRRDLPIATEVRRARLFPMVAQAACEAGVPVGLFDALVVQESRYNQAAISPKGAIGLSQLMPGTARYLSVTDPFDALFNLRGGARYLREQLTAFGRVDLALAAYNAGPGRVRARWAVPRIAETQGYVSSVTRGWHLGVAREAALFDFHQGTPTQPSSIRRAGRAVKIIMFDGES